MWLLVVSLVVFRLGLVQVSRVFVVSLSLVLVLYLYSQLGLLLLVLLVLSSG